MQRVVLALATAVALFAPSTTRASIVEQFVAGPVSYNGNTASVNVYLQETDTGGTTLFGNSSVTGLFSFAIYATQTAGASSGQSTISSFTPNSAFTSNVSTSSAGSLPANSIDYSGSQPFGTTSGQSPTLVSGTAGNGTYQLLLGTLNFNVASSATFSLVSQNNSTYVDNGDGSQGGDSTYTLPSGSGKQYDIDGGGTQTGAAGTLTFTGTDSGISTFTVAQTAGVPEPSSMLLCGLAVSGLGYFGYRRRKAQAAAVAVA